MGVIWINRDKEPYQFDVSIHSPEKVKPSQTIEVPISVNGINDTDEVYLTLAAVDVGVLNLTNYKSPNPLQYFLSKRQLETQINDNYARLIDNLHGKPAQLREGGDTMMDSSRASVPAKNIKIVSLFSGVVKLAKNGKVSVPLDIPDFNGQLKLMAVAWDKNKMGSAQKNLYVNDDVVIQPSLPRFMSSGDEAKIAILVHNLHGEAGDYSLQLQTDSLLTPLSEKEYSEINFSLAKGESLSKQFIVKANKAGDAKLQISLTGSKQYQLQKSLNIGIRGLGLPVSEQTLQQIPGHSELQINQQDMFPYEENTVTKTLSLSSGLNLGVYDLLEKLDRYPHGCLEQLISRVDPLLSVNLLAERWDYPIDPMVDSRINETISLVLDKQRYNGSFGLWKASDKEEQWLSLYAMEFLIKAQNKSYPVPDFFIQRGLKWVSQYISSQYLSESNKELSEQLSNLAYAHYVLVLAGQGQVENIRYLAKQYALQMPTLLAYAQLVKALQLMGYPDLKLKPNVLTRPVPE